MSGRFAAFFVRPIQAVATCLLFAIVLINGVNVVGRYVFNAPISWADEVMLYLMIATVMLGTVRTSWEAAHIRMDALVLRLPAAARRIVLGISDLLVACVAATIAVAGTPVVLKLLEFDQRSDAAHVPMALPHGMVVLGFALAALAMLLRVILLRAGKQCSDTD